MARRKSVSILQSVIVKRTHPLVKTARDAYRVARHYGAASGSKADPTSTSFRFRQASPKLFFAFRTKRLTPDVSVVYGLVKPLVRAVRPNPKSSKKSVIRLRQGLRPTTEPWTELLRRVEIA